MTLMIIKVTISNTKMLGYIVLSFIRISYKLGLGPTTQKMVYYEEKKSYFTQKLGAIQRVTKDRREKWSK